MTDKNQRYADTWAVLLAQIKAGPFVLMIALGFVVCGLAAYGFVGLLKVSDGGLKATIWFLLTMFFGVGIAVFAFRRKKPDSR